MKRPPEIEMASEARVEYDENRFRRAENNGESRPVSKDEFFSSVGQMDVHPQIQPGPYPWEAHWKTPGRLTRGKSVDYHPDGHRGRIATKFFVRA